MPTRKKKLAVQVTSRPCYGDAQEAALRALGARSAGPKGRRANPAPSDIDLINLASDLEHGMLLSDPDA